MLVRKLRKSIAFLEQKEKEPKEPFSKIGLLNTDERISEIGFVLSVLPPAIIALITLGPSQALVVIVGFWLINFVVEEVLGPLFMKQSLKISLLTSFLSMLIWGWILGLPGAILGIPLTMVIMKIHGELKDKQIQ